MIFSPLSSFIFVFTIGYYSLSPFIFHSLGFTPMQNGLFYAVYSLGIVLGSLILATVLAQNNSKRTFTLMIILYPIYF